MTPQRVLCGVLGGKAQCHAGPPVCGIHPQRMDVLLVGGQAHMRASPRIRPLGLFDHPQLSDRLIGLGVHGDDAPRTPGEVPAALAHPPCRFDLLEVPILGVGHHLQCELGPFEGVVTGP